MQSQRLSREVSEITSHTEPLGSQMNADDALLAIQELLDGVIWTQDTLNQIAAIMEAAGYDIRDSN